jgi:ABC-2 type transport system ATP-binding protein
MRPAIEIADVWHRYGERVALAGIDLEIPERSLFGLLGPNGGGKSTLFRILATLAPLQQGRVWVLGHDVGTEAAAIRRQIGVVFQHPSVDGKLTVEENLRHHGWLYGLEGRALRGAIETQLERFGLVDRRHELVERLSGGLARRVELAKGLLPSPRLLLLDEPSAGLDPGARRDLLAQIVRLRDDEGVTVILTTHHMDEAERCDRIALLDRGQLVAVDQPDALKAQVGGDVVVISGTNLDRLAAALEGRFGVHGTSVDGTLRLEHPRGHELVRDMVESFPDDVRHVSFGKPTLEDVFVRLTGHAFFAAGAEGPWA